MSSTLITPGRPITLRVRPNRLLAAGLAAVMATAGATLALSGDDPVATAKPNSAPSGPIIFGDAPVLKGARGGKSNAVTLRQFGDPTVRKGAGRR
jgi:hypothetical protein